MKLVIGAFAVLAVALAWPIDARAQALTPDQAAQIKSQCQANPQEAACVEARKLCLERYDTMSAEEQGICRDLEWDPETYADEQVSSAAGKCSVGQPSCDGVYDACRAGTVTCEQLKQAACGPGAARCDERYLCTPDAVAAVCRFAKPRFDFAYTSLQYTYVDATEDEIEDTTHLLSVASYIKGLWKSPVGFAYAVDMELGAGLTGGFLYEYNLGLGLGFRIGNRFGMGITGGGGLSGFTGGRVPFGLRVPVEAFLVMDFSVGQLVAFGRPAWVYQSSDRQGGSDMLGDLASLDEMTIGVGLTSLGTRRSSSRYQFGYAGWSVSLKLEEKMGVRFYGIGLGIGQSNVSE